MFRAHFILLSTAFLIASSAQAQTVPFTLRVQQGTTTSNAADGASIAFQADAIGRPTDAIVTFTHLGVLQTNTNNFVGVATVTAIDVSGSTDFQVTTFALYTISGFFGSTFISAKSPPLPHNRPSV